MPKTVLLKAAGASAVTVTLPAVSLLSKLLRGIAKQGSFIFIAHFKRTQKKHLNFDKTVRIETLNQLNCIKKKIK